MTNFLLIGLFVGTLISCGDQEWEDSGIDNPRNWLYEIVYENATGVSPIEIDYYSVDTLHLVLNDSTFVQSSKNGNVKIALPSGYYYDSIFVTFPKGCMYKCYREGDLDDPFNMCSAKSYVGTVFAKDHRRYTFTFTKEMLDKAQ